MERDAISEALINNIVATQFDDDEKVSRSNFLITNDETQLVIPQVLALHKKLLSL